MPMPHDGASLGASNSRGSRFRLGDPAVATRIATAMVGVPVVLVLVVIGGAPFKAAVILVALVAGWEAFQMLKSRGHRPALLFVLAVSALLAAAPGSSNPRLWWQATVVVGALAAGLWVLIAGEGSDAFVDWALTITIAIYAGGLLGFLTGVRLLGHGLQLVILVLVLNWAYDTGAYFTGRTFGRTPFMAHISQKKTWEGVAGGVLLALVAALVLAVPLGVNIGVSVVVGLVVAVSAQVGDLVESLMKRYCDMKDSGSIIPGHGGLLDRIDSLLFSGAAAYYVLLVAGYH